MPKGRKAEKLSDLVSDQKETHVKSRAVLHAQPSMFEMSDEYPEVPAYLLDDDFIAELESDDFFDDPRIQRWGAYRNSLTKKDLSDMIE